MRIHDVKDKSFSLFQEFKTFAARGNVIDLAIGVMIGAAFNSIVQSLVNDIILPPIGLIVGKVDFSNLFIDLSGNDYKTIGEAKIAGTPTINYGVFVNNFINFLIVAFVAFFIVRELNRWKNKERKYEPTTKTCPFCALSIPKAAVRCGHCTSELK